MTHSFDPSSFPGLSRRDHDAGFELPPRVIDLAASFPLLYFMLASDSGAFARRLEVIRLVELGKPLPDVAAAYRLPFSLRRIQPESCVAPLPWVNWSKEATVLLANHIPECPREAGNWLPAVFYAARHCHEDFAIWLARQRPVFAGPQFDCRQLLPLALYAWHSSQTEGPLQSISMTPWSPNLGLPRALDETDAWLTRLHLLAQSGSYPIQDTWLAGGHCGGFDFVPIVSFDGLITERLAMRNCLHTYMEKLASGACRLFAVKQGQQSLATLEIVADRMGRIGVSQLKGPGNSAPLPQIVTAARTWFESQPARRLPVLRPAPLVRATERLLQLFAPYRDAIAAPDASVGFSIASLKEQVIRIRQHVIGFDRRQRIQIEPRRDRAAAARQVPLRSVEHQRVHAELRARLGDDVCGSWFGSLEIDGFDARTVRLSVPVKFLRGWIQAHYIDDLRVCCATVWPNVEQVELVVRPPVRVAPAAIPPVPPAHVPTVPPAFGIEQQRFRDGTPAYSVRIEDIMAVVSRHYGISRADLLSERRHRSVVLPRQIGMYLARHLGSRGLPEIGRRFGDRDHTTVLHAIRKIDLMIGEDAQFREEVAALLRELSAVARPVG